MILFTSTDEGHIIVKSKQLQDDKDLDFIAFNRTSQFTLRADAQGNDKLTIDHGIIYLITIGKTIGIERTIGDEINSISSNIITTINITTTGDNVDAIVDIMLIEDELPDKLRIGADNKNFNLPTIFANDTFNINPDLGYTESLQYYIYNDTEFNIKDYKSDLNLIANGDIKIKAGGDLTLDITGEFIQEVGQSQQVGSKLVVNNNAEFNGSLTTFSGQVKFSGEIERTESAEIFTTAVKTITTSQPLVGLGVGGLSTEGFNIGFYGEYQINGVNKYTGLIRDRTSKDYILFNDLDYTPQPEATITPSSLEFDRASLFLKDITLTATDKLSMIKLTTNTITGTTQIYNIPPKPPQNSAFIRPFLVFNNDTDVNDLEWMKFWNKDNEVKTRTFL